MAKLKHLLAVAFCAAALPALADTGFKLPFHYQLELVDGISDPPEYSRYSRFVTLTPGRHQVVVRFKDYFGNGRTGEIVETANPIVVDIFDLKPNQEITFRYRSISEKDDARKFARQQKVELITTDKKPLGPSEAEYFVMTSETAVSMIRDYRRELMSLGRLYAPTYVAGEHRGIGMTSYGTPTIEATNSSDAYINSQRATMDAPATSAAQEGTLATSSPRGGRASGRGQSITFDQLVQLYNSADSQTKKRFLQYVLKE